MSVPSDNAHDNDSDERESLLPKSTKVQKITPLPKIQLTVLSLLQMAEPLVSQVINPWINQLVSELGITGGDESKVGFYSGLIVSLFFLTEASFTLQWSRLSDSIGRKPVVQVGLFGIMLSMICFGLSRTFWTLVISRCLCGVLNGNVGVIKSMLTEISDTTNRAQVFALASMTWSVGSTIGPFIGGTLARPHDRFPGFKHPFWAKYPYFLPCFASACYAAFAFTICAALLKETNPRRPKKSEFPSDEPADEFSREETVPFRQVLTYPVVISVSNYSALGFIDIACNALIPLFYSSSIELGGLGLDPSTIGLILGSYGCLKGIFQILFFAAMVRRWGAKNVYMSGLYAFFAMFPLFAVISLLARANGGMTPLVWAVVYLQLFFGILKDMSYGCIFMYMAAAAPNQKSLGAVNGLGQTSVALFRAIGPATANSMFALSVKHNIMGGYGVYLVLVILTGFIVTLGNRLPRELWKKD